MAPGGMDHVFVAVCSFVRKQTWPRKPWPCHPVALQREFERTTRAVGGIEARVSESYNFVVLKAGNTPSRQRCLSRRRRLRCGCRD